MSSKRHAKPTDHQLLERTYRRLIAMDKESAADRADARHGINSIEATGWHLSEAVGALVARCDKQDEQIDRLIGLMKEFLDRDRKLRAQLGEANAFMARPVPAPSGTAGHDHGMRGKPIPTLVNEQAGGARNKFWNDNRDDLLDWSMR